MVRFLWMAMLSAFLMIACDNESTEKKSQKLSVIATIYPQYDWLKQIIGDKNDAIDLKLLIKNGTDMHSFNPSAKDIAAIAHANMIVFVGGESDEWIKKTLSSTPKPERMEINLMKALGSSVKKEEIVEGMEREAKEEATKHHEHQHEKKENDEHIWLSLKNAELLVDTLAVALGKLDSNNATMYKTNAADYNNKIHEMDMDIKSYISNIKQKVVLFGDRFPFRYLVDDYHINYYAAFAGCSTESEASFKTIAFLASKMDSLDLPALFVIENSDKKLARAILDASKKSKQALVLTLNSMQSITDEQINANESYLSIMADNLDVLKKGMKSKIANHDEL